MPITFSQGLGVAALFLLFVAAQLLKKYKNEDLYPFIFCLAPLYFVYLEADKMASQRSYALMVFLAVVAIREFINESDRKKDK